MQRCECYRSEKQADFKIIVTFPDGFKTSGNNNINQEHVLRGCNNAEHGGRPIRIDIYGEVPCADFIYGACKAALNQQNSEGIHIHVG